MKKLFLFSISLCASLLVICTALFPLFKFKEESTTFYPSTYTETSENQENPYTMYALNTKTPLPKNLSVTLSESISPSGSYACILEDNTYFYTQPNEECGIFLLPKTYYVKVLDYQANYCKIEYLYDSSLSQKITGYAKTNQLTFVEYTPKRPYLYYIFDVYYQIGDTKIEDPAFLTQLKISCAYYGDFYFGGKTYCYVLRGDTFGYVPKPNTLSYEENTEYADYLAQKPIPPEEQPAKQNAPIGQIALFVALSLLVPILAALLLKQSKRNVYYEVDETAETSSP